jgi:hypothetical protein
MKSSRAAAAAVVVVLAASLSLVLFAQTQVQSMQTVISSAPGAAEPAPNDSIVQLAAEAQGLALVPPEQVPPEGTFWTVMPGSDGIIVPWPCAANLSLPIYAIADGQFLVDATGGQVAWNMEPSSAQTTTATVAGALLAEANAVVDLITQIQAAADQQAEAAVRGLSLD